MAGRIGLIGANGPTGSSGHAGRIGLIGANGTTVAATGSSSSSGGHGGLLGGLENAAHWVGSKSELAAHDIEAAPAGLYGLGKAEYGSLKQTVEHPLVSKQKFNQMWSHPLRPVKGAAETPAIVAQGKGLLASTEQAVKHPLRDPFLTLTTLLPAGHGLTSGLVRVSRAARAVDAGDFAGAVKHLAATPEMPQRILQVPGSDRPVSLHASQNPLARAVQALHDKAIQKALDANPEKAGKIAGRVQGYGLKRLSGAEAESERRAQRMSMVDVHRLEAQRLTPRTQAALGRIAGKLSESSGEDRLRQAALELRSIQVMPEEASAFHARQAAEGVNPELNAQTARLYGQVAQRGLLRLENGKVRVNPAFKGLARADSLVSAVQRGGEQLVRRYGLMGDEGPEARLNKPGQVYAGATYVSPTDQIATPTPEEKTVLVYHATTPEIAERINREVRMVSNSKRIYVSSRRADADYEGAVVPLLVPERLLQLVHEFPTGEKRYTILAHEIRRHHILPGATEGPTIERLRRGVMSGLVGGESARPGEGFVSERPLLARQPKAEVAEARGSSGSVGEAKKPIPTTIRYTGEGRRQGQVVANTQKAVALHGRQLLRYANTVEQRTGIANKFGHEFRRSAHDVLLQLPGEKNLPLDAETKALLGKGDLNFEQAETLRQKLDALDAEFQQKPPKVDEAPIHQQAPEGKTWVDSRVLRAANDQAAAARNRATKAVDAINSAITAGTVFFKPAHIPQRFVTDLVTNVMQGSLRNFAATKRLWAGLSEHDRDRLVAASGTHGFQAMPQEGDTVAARAARAGSAFFAKNVDRAFRVNALLYEMKKAGFADTPQAVSGFLDKLESRGHGMDAASWAKVDWVAKRADRAAIAYDRLSPGEKASLARVLWFYPWLKGSAAFVGHTAVEHPYKTAVLGAAGKRGEQAQERALGALPYYEYNLLPLGGGRVTNLDSLAPTSGATSFLEALARPSSLADNLNPAETALLAAVKTPPGRPATSPLGNVLYQLLSTLPESHLLTKQQTSKQPLFPASPLQQFLHSFVSPTIPRRINLAKLHKDAQSALHPRS